MGLFAALASQASETVAKKNTSSSSDLPTVVQLYWGLAPVRFEQSTAQTPSYAVLSYAAVPVTTSLTSENEPPETPMGGTSARGSRKQMAIVPELGLWNCSVSKRGGSQQSSLQDGPLLRIPNAPSTFFLTIDLSKPNQVESTLTLLQETLVRYLIARPAAPATSASTEEKEGATEGTKVQPETATTSLYALRSVQFGLAPNDDASAEKMAGEAPDENDRKVMVTLLICAQLAPSTEEYRDKQTQALLLYHLRRYSAALKAHLCFVGGDVDPPSTAVAATTSGEEQASGININTAAGAASNEQQPAVSKRQLAAVLLQLAQGKTMDSNVLSDQEATTEASPETESDVAAANPLVHGPHTAAEQDELIETVLLRNANYQGQWDASKDSLWKVLPPGDDGDSSNKVDIAKKTAANAGDNAWMQELLDSVEAGTAKTPPRKPKKGPASSAQKTPNDAAVSDFFSNLLQS